MDRIIRRDPFTRNTPVGVGALGLPSWQNMSYAGKAIALGGAAVTGLLLLKGMVIHSLIVGGATLASASYMTEKGA